MSQAEITTILVLKVMRILGSGVSGVLRDACCCEHGQYYFRSTRAAVFWSKLTTIAF